MRTPYINSIISAFPERSTQLNKAIDTSRSCDPKQHKKSEKSLRKSQNYNMFK